MSRFSEALSQASDRNRELLFALSQTDYAPSSLQQCSNYINDLNTQISTTEAQIKKLHAITEDERKDHVKYRDSTMKRFAYRLGGQKGKDKFSSKAEKEEREFLEAWQKEREAHESKEELERSLSRAQADKPHLESEAKKHADAQRDLDALYQHLFSGPTPEVPGEDALELDVQKRREAFDTCTADVGRARQAFEALQRAEQAMGQGMSHIDSALNASTYDMFGGGTFADMMERDALANAQNQVLHANRYLDDARRIHSEIGGMGAIEIDQGHFLSDVVFDNIFTDMRQHERIEQSAMQMHQAMQQLRTQVSNQQDRVQSSQGRLQQATNDLESARRELQGIRARAFEQYGGSGYGEGVAGGEYLPPAYTV